MSSVVPAVVGALTGTIGTLVLWITQKCYERTQLTNQRKAIAHKTMMCLEAQRTFVEGLKRLIDKYRACRKNIKDVPSIYGNSMSVPRLNVFELDFLLADGIDQNILPKLSCAQQNFDQVIDTLNRTTQERRSLHFCEQGSSQYEAWKVCLEESEANLTELMEKLLGEYPNTETLLEEGVKKSISGFKPIFVRISDAPRG